MSKYFSKYNFQSDRIFNHNQCVKKHISSNKYDLGLSLTMCIETQKHCCFKGRRDANKLA